MARLVTRRAMLFGTRLSSFEDTREGKIAFNTISCYWNDKTLIKRLMFVFNSRFEKCKCVV